MKKQLAATIIIATFPFLFISCVSSLLKDAPPTFSKEISVSPPANPFTKTSTSVYPSWKSSATGNVIAIVSDCDANSSFSINNLHALVEEPLTGVKVIKEETFLLQNKPAVRRQVTALLDDREIEVESVSFKRKSCNYVTSLSGKVGGLAADHAQYVQFIENLRFE